MSGIKKFIAILIALIVLWSIWGFVRGGDSQEVAIVKIACDVDRGEDGKWVLKSLNSVFPDFTLDEIRGKSGVIYPVVIAYLGEQSAAASGAAQLNGRWLSLADAASEYAYSNQLAYVLALGSEVRNETFAEAARLRLSSSIRMKSECQAFINRLNS